MAPTRQQREAFGRRLTELRKERYSSAAGLARAMTERGEGITGAAVGTWERGEYSPRSPDQLRLLEDLLGSEGELASLLGIETSHGLSDRVTALEQALGRILALLEEAEARPPRRRGRGGV